MSDALHVFISYARADGQQFAVSLSAALEVAGFDPFLDQHDIVAGEPWEERLTRLLHQADTVVYVITPASARSERCVWELDQAARLSKRVIPVVAEEVPVDQMPAALQRLNFVFFNRDKSFGEALKQLVEALRTDLDWVRKHTQFTEEATRWLAEGEKEEFLLRRQQLVEAQAWMEDWTAGKPEITQQQRAFIQASDDAERRRDDRERQQIEDMRLAQEARARALKSAGRATLAAFVTALILIVAAVTGGWFTFRLYTQAEALEQEVLILQAQIEAMQASVELREQDVSIMEARLGEAYQPEPRPEPQPEPQPETMSPPRASIPAPRSPSRGPASTGSGAEPDDAGEPDLLDPYDDFPALSEKSVELPTMELPAPVPAVPATRWNIDVFWCAGPGGTANRAKAQTVVDYLETQKGAPGARLTIGQVRAPRILSEEVNARPGYRVRSDVIRAEDSEKTEGAALQAMIGEAGISGVELGHSGTPTARYLSVFFCGS